MTDQQVVTSMPPDASYWSDWRQWTWQCPTCGWTGPGDALAIEPFRELAELWCPTGDHKFGLLSYPTVEETRQTAERGVPEAVSQAAAASDLEKQRTQTAKEVKRARSKRMPTLDGTTLTFTLVLAGGDTWSEPTWLTVQHEGREIYREPSGYEWWEEILKVCDRLQRAYPGRISWIDPAQAGIALLGDDFSAPGRISDYLREHGLTPPHGRWAE